MAAITYNGTNHDEIANALTALKTTTARPCTFEPVPGPEHCGFTQVWPDGQRLDNRWILRVGDTLNTDTGAVTAAGELVDYADVVVPVAPVEADGVEV